MPQIDLVDVMLKPPGRCGICNTTPMEDNKPKIAIDTNVDVDWGNNLYICDECASVISDLTGRVTTEDFENLKAEHNQLTEDHKRLRARYRKLAGDLEKVIEGKKAEGRRKTKKTEKTKKRERSAA